MIGRPWKPNTSRVAASGSPGEALRRESCDPKTFALFKDSGSLYWNLAFRIVRGVNSSFAPGTLPVFQVTLD